MHTLIVADIFGRTAALEKMASALLGTVDIFDPYGAKFMDFTDEKQAYGYFTANLGLDEYTQDLRDYLLEHRHVSHLVGFSVGAAAIWNLSNQSVVSDLVKATCFYGSQIRHNPKVRPKCPIALVFPSSEAHFSVAELITSLSGLDNVTIKQVPFLHGFMNQHSENYDLRGYNQEIHALRNSANSQGVTLDASMESI